MVLLTRGLKPELHGYHRSPPVGQLSVGENAAQFFLKQTFANRLRSRTMAKNRADLGCDLEQNVTASEGRTRIPVGMRAGTRNLRRSAIIE